MKDSSKRLYDSMMKVLGKGKVNFSFKTTNIIGMMACMRLLRKRESKKTKKQNKQHQKRRKKLQIPKKKKEKELLKSTLFVNGGGGGTTLKLSPTKDVFKASELDKNPLWQSCKLKIKIPISPLKVPRESLPSPTPTSLQYGILLMT